MVSARACPHDSGAMHTAPLGAPSWSEIPYSFAWDRKVPSIRGVPLGGTAGVLSMEKLMYWQEGITHLTFFFTIRLASGCGRRTESINYSKHYTTALDAIHIDLCQWHHTTPLWEITTTKKTHSQCQWASIKKMVVVRQGIQNMPVIILNNTPLRWSTISTTLAWQCVTWWRSKHSDWKNSYNLWVTYQVTWNNTNLH